MIGDVADLAARINGVAPSPSVASPAVCCRFSSGAFSRAFGLAPRASSRETTSTASSCRTASERPAVTIGQLVHVDGRVERRHPGVRVAEFGLAPFSSSTAAAS